MERKNWRAVSAAQRRWRMRLGPRQVTEPVVAASKSEVRGFYKRWAVGLDLAPLLRGKLPRLPVGWAFEFVAPEERR